MSIVNRFHLEHVTRKMKYDICFYHDFIVRIFDDVLVPYALSIYSFHSYNMFCVKRFDHIGIGHTEIRVSANIWALGWLRDYYWNLLLILILFEFLNKLIIFHSPWFLCDRTNTLHGYTMQLSYFNFRKITQGRECMQFLLYFRNYVFCEAHFVYK